MGNYLYLPVIALIFYTFLLCAFIGHYKIVLIRSFLLLLGVSVIWTLGSVLMRTNFASLYEIWYHLSLFGVVLIPYTMFTFVICFIEERQTALMRYMGLSTLVLYAVNCVTGVFLAPPSIVAQAGRVSFVYQPTPFVLVLFVAPAWFCVKIVQMCIRSYRDGVVSVTKMVPILCGGFFLLVGNIIIMVPSFSGIPLDLLSGNVNAIFLFYALLKKRLFKLSSLFSATSCGLLAVALSLPLFWGSITPLLYFSNNTLHLTGEADIVLIIILFGITVLVVYMLLHQILNQIFIKDEVRQNDLLKDFSITVSKTLNKSDLLDELLHVIKHTLYSQNVYIFLPSAADSGFDIMKSASPLSHRQFPLKRDNPMIVYLQTHNDLLYMKDFLRTTAYQSLWESEKEMLHALKLEYIAPLHNEAELVGFVALSKREGKKEYYSLDELSFLSSATSVASIALKNAMLYEKACYEARTDALTGVYNRKYFQTILEEQFVKCQGSALTLAILNVDDFKLYNQLYGNAEGDLALQRIAQLAQSMVGEHGFVARYSGKEFAIILPAYDSISATELTHAICEQVSSLNKNGKDYAMKCLTISAGLCSIPYGATTLKQLLSNVDMAVYQVKQNGKNALAVYSEGVALDDKTNPIVPKEDVYSSYSSTIYALTAAIDTKDHYTFQHSNNVGYYACALAAAFGLSEDSIKIIQESALLHDIGKIGIPEDILNKPGKLSLAEYEIMQGHVENSIGIIRHLPSLDYVIPAVIGHHERYDGKGYPRRIGGEDIPLAARILCVADSFDAMISKRSYKDAMPIEKGLAIVESELGKQFDPTLGALFVKLVREGTITPRVQTAP